MEPDGIESVCLGSPRIAADWKHSNVEVRFVAVGTEQGKAAFVTMRDSLIRPLSARYMHAREVARYETQDP